MNRFNYVTSSTQLYRAIYRNDIKSVTFLLDHRFKSFIVNSTFEESNGTECYQQDIGKTPLEYAIEKGVMEMVELLLQNSADVNPELNSKMSLIQYSCQKSHSGITKLLINYGANVNYVNPLLPKRYTCLHYAVEHQNELTVKLLLNEGSFINATAENNITPLHIAAKSGKYYSHFYAEETFLKILLILLENGADVNAQTDDNKTALYFAVQARNSDAVQTILDHHPDKNIEDNLPSLGLAISCDHTDEINSSYFTSQAKHMDPSVLFELSKSDNNNKSKINSRYAKNSCYHSTIVNLLINYGLTLKPDHEYYKMFIFAAASIGHFKTIENFVTSDRCDVNLSVDPSSINSTRILHISIINNRSDISVLLIENGADVNVKDENNKTPIYYAVKNNNTEVTKKLVAYKADVQPIFLNHATYNNNLEINLIKSGVDMNTIIETKMMDEKLTLLLIAMQNNNDSIIQFLVEHGANPNVYDAPFGYPPLWYAVNNKNEKIINMLLNKGANINLRYSEDNKTVLCSAVQDVEDIEIITLLLKKGADVNCQDKSGFTPLHYAIDKKKITPVIAFKIIELLLKYNADINCKNKFGMTPLHCATSNTSYDNNSGIPIIELLLKFGADINSTDKFSRTALYYTIHKSYATNFRTLLDNGAEINEIKKENPSLYCIALDLYDKHKLDYHVACFLHENMRCVGSYEDYDDYDDDNICISEAEIIKMLKQHIIQLNQAKFWINDEGLQALDYNKEFPPPSHMLNSCDKEISNMKIETIGDSCVTFHDVLMNDFDKFARNKNVMEILELEEYKKTYPIYGKIITGNYRKAKFRIPLQKEFIHSFCYQCDGFNRLPYNCIEKICTYLSLQDMRELLNLND